jgi:acylphosphatase
MRTVHLLITGRVQGVGYRDWTRREAVRLGLSGWVRNRPEGSVEALIHGDDATIGQMLDACRGGPPAARVEAVTLHDTHEPVPAGFEVRPTG